MKINSNKKNFITIVIVAVVLAGIIFLNEQSNNQVSGGMKYAPGIVQGNNGGE